MTNDDDNNRIMVNPDSSYNPYEDEGLSETQSDVPSINQREPFNDVVKHGDIINGYQRNRTLSDYPRRTRPWIRLYATITLLLIVGGVIWDLFR